MADETEPGLCEICEDREAEATIDVSWHESAGGDAPKELVERSYRICSACYAILILRPKAAPRSGS